MRAGGDRRFGDWQPLGPHIYTQSCHSGGSSLSLSQQILAYMFFIRLVVCRVWVVIWL